MSTLGYLSLFTAEKKAWELSCAWKRCWKVSLRRDSLLCSLSPVMSPLSWRTQDKTVLPVLHAIPLLQSDRALIEVWAGEGSLSVELKAAHKKTT